MEHKTVKKHVNQVLTDIYSKLPSDRINSRMVTNASIRFSGPSGLIGYGRTSTQPKVENGVDTPLALYLYLGAKPDNVVDLSKGEVKRADIFRDKLLPCEVVEGEMQWLSEESGQLLMTSEVVDSYLESISALFEDRAKMAA